jgi:hypothetical protein
MIWNSGSLCIKLLLTGDEYLYLNFELCRSYAKKSLCFHSFCNREFILPEN